MTFGEFRRLYLIMYVFISHGLEELIPKIPLAFLWRFWFKCLFWIPKQHTNKPLGERVRLALEKLGTVWIKFGQMISTRRDLLPTMIADELAMLQDSVQPFDGRQAIKIIENSLGAPIESAFDNFDIIPLASASISQVHTAILKKNGSAVIIKVIRPDIIPVIKADIKLIYRLSCWMARLFPNTRRLRPQEVVLNYEKKLFNELDLLGEAANTIQLRRNFSNSNMLYFPKIYSNYCSKNILVMERIYGIPISDILTLEKHGINMKLLAERGVEIFFTQVFRDNFFHADMHPGNIFVSYLHPEDPQYIGVDCGVVGSLNKEDKRYLAENFISFFNRDYHKVAELHIDSGWVPPETNIEDFEFAIRTVCEPIFEKPLAEISFGHVLFNLFNTARRFNMEVQPQLFLLQKTLFYVEGLGRQLYPQLDLWKTAKPFLEKWLKDQVGIAAIIRMIKEKSPLWIEKIPELPELFYSNLRQRKNVYNNIERLLSDIKIERDKHYKLIYSFSIGAILMFIGTTILISFPDRNLISTELMIAGLLIWLLGLSSKTKY